ncbi:MAG: hypothetical protein Q8L88_14315 [Bacteroidota bacterium]|nr:hypothetical protein [Bacteroidota bacterium]
MITSSFTTPVLFLIFNRPETTAKVFEAIRKAKPSRLYIAADGARELVVGEFEKCRRVREIARNVDWQCEVKTLFREKNLGCKVAVSSAIDWFFDHEEEGIILEDDCLPNPSFFTFCNTLLERYRTDVRVMHIGGTSYLPHRPFGEKNASYYFSRDPYVWGWASWRRAWQLYDVKMKKFPEFLSTNMLETYYDSKREVRFWRKEFEKVFSGGMDTWDYQWKFTVLRSSGLCVIPKVNLITNIGFGTEATHTKQSSDQRFSIPSEELTAIVHPKNLVIDTEADAAIFESIHGGSIFKRVVNKLKKIVIEKI